MQMGGYKSEWLRNPEVKLWICETKLSFLSYVFKTCCYFFYLLFFFRNNLAKYQRCVHDDKKSHYSIFLFFDLRETCECVDKVSFPHFEKRFFFSHFIQ